MINASLAQLVEQLICNQQVVSSTLTGSSTFMRSSSAVEQVTVNHLVAGSIPAFAAIAPVAQLVEQLTFNQLVRGSSPRGCTT